MGTSCEKAKFCNLYICLKSATGSALKKSLMAKELSTSLDWSLSRLITDFGANYYILWCSYVRTHDGDVILHPPLGLVSTEKLKRGNWDCYHIWTIISHIIAPICIICTTKIAPPSHLRFFKSKGHIVGSTICFQKKSLQRKIGRQDQKRHAMLARNDWLFGCLHVMSKARGQRKVLRSMFLLLFFLL